MIIGCIGLALNILSATILHEHSHDKASKTVFVDFRGRVPSMSQHRAHRHESTLDQQTKSRARGHDLGVMGVLLHIIGDAVNNIGVIIAAAVIWKTSYAARFYADPAVSMGIAAMIIISSLPLMKRSGSILMQSTPSGVNPDDVKHDLETLPGVLAIHDLHIWLLNQEKAVASVHVTVSNGTVKSIHDFMQLADTINECFHAYGIHSATLQPEIVSVEDVQGPVSAGEKTDNADERIHKRAVLASTCRVGCRTTVCEGSTCCD